MSNAIPVEKAPSNTSRRVHHRQAVARSRSNKTALGG
jgi:hypothetical protein